MSYKIGDLVWGKMGRFPPWPGMVAEPTEDIKKLSKGSGTSHCVYFFGSHNYSWLEEKCIKPYAEMKEANTKANKTNAFFEACKEIEDYIASGSTGIPSLQKKSKKRTSENAKENNDKIKTPLKKKKESLGTTTPKPSIADSIFVSPKSISKKKKVTTLDSNVLENRDSSFFKSPRGSLIDRPLLIDPEIKLTDVSTVSDNLKNRNITPTQKTIGFLGLGIMGSRVAKYILHAGHKLMVWNRTPDKCEPFANAGAEVGMTPADVVQHSDIIFCCVSGPEVSKDLVNGNCGVLSEMNESKGYVELTSIDIDTSRDIDTNVTSKGGRYLEVQMLGSMTEAESGNLVLLCAGDKTLYNDCISCLNSAAKEARFVGPIGSAIELYLVYQVVRNTNLGAAAEIISLAKCLNLPIDTFIEILHSTSFNSPLFEEKLNLMKEEKFPTSQPLQHAQKDLKFALDLGEKLKQALPLTATLNEVYKHACRIGLGNHDASSLFLRDYKY